MGTSLTVFFDNPFWVGVFERVDDGKLSVCKVTFGAEPKDYEVWEKALMVAGSEKCDWTDKAYIEPILEEIKK